MITQELTYRQIAAFLHLEARLADENDYDAWEALWTDDALYWVPAGEPADPMTQMQVIYDNRSRIATRIAQLKTGKRYTQAPPSRMRRLISNIETVGQDGPDAVVEANFLLVEGRERGNVMWAGRTTYRLRPMDGQIKLAYKKVSLVNSADPLPSLGFLI